MHRQDIKNLKQRYLIWLYKTTKESLDKIERKFTQLSIDRFILKELEREDKTKRLKRLIDEFKVYIQNKEKEGFNLKYEKRELKSHYHFLTLKLKAIEEAIVKILGKNALGKIKLLYEQAMIARILSSQEEDKAR